MLGICVMFDACRCFCISGFRAFGEGLIPAGGGSCGVGQGGEREYT